MPDAMSVNGAGNVKRSIRNLRRRRLPYSPAELEDLSKIVGRTREWLQQHEQIHLLNEKSIWLQIADEMHLNGWNKRHWTSIRMRAQTSLNALDQYRQSVTQTDSRDACARGNLIGSVSPPSEQPSSLMSPAHLAKNRLISAQTARNHCDCTDNGAGRDDHVALPPPLTPSSQASACNTMSMMRVSRSAQMIGESTSSAMISPQIVSVSSRAVTQSISGLWSGIRVGGSGAGGVGDGDRVQGEDAVRGYWKSGRLSWVAMADEKLMEQARAQSGDMAVKANRLLSVPENSQDIDMVISSDEEVGEGVNASVKLSNDDNLPGVSKPSDSRSVEISRNVQKKTGAMNVWRAEERKKRMEIYAMKLEVLKLKKVYWQQRLCELGRVN